MLFLISNYKTLGLQGNEIVKSNDCTNPLEWMPGVAVYGMGKVFLVTEFKNNFYYFDDAEPSQFGVERKFFNTQNPGTKTCFRAEKSLAKVPNDIFE